MGAPAHRALRWLHRFEDGLIAVAVLVLVLLAGTQIVLRNLFDTGFSWADPLLRALVLWTAVLGALAAARENKHIGLDVITHFATGRTAALLRFVALGFAAVVCALMAWYGIDLVKLDLDSGSVAFSGVPVWMVELIVPVGFALLAVRLGVHAFLKPPPRIDPIVAAQSRESEKS